jgi:hypothetical protein
MRTLARCLVLLLPAVLMGSCSSRPAGLPSPDPLASARRCPVPIQVSLTDPRPIGIRVRNERPDTVWVYLDQCDGSVWVGDVGPATVRAFPLRPPLVEFGNGLRFHVHPRGDLGGYFAAALPVDTARILELTIPAKSPVTCTYAVYVDGERFSGTLRDVGAERIAEIRMEYPSGSAMEAGDLCPSIHVRTHGPGAGQSRRPGG